MFAAIRNAIHHVTAPKVDDFTKAVGNAMFAIAATTKPEHVTTEVLSVASFAGVNSVYGFEAAKHNDELLRAIFEGALISFIDLEGRDPHLATGNGEAQNKTARRMVDALAADGKTC